MTGSDRSTTDSVVTGSATDAGEVYQLRLFITGLTPRSTAAITRIKEICEEYLPGRYVLDVIDIYQQPILAKNEQVIATPTVIKMLPLPLRRLVGDLSDKERVLCGLDIRTGHQE